MHVPFQKMSSKAKKSQSHTRGKPGSSNTSTISGSYLLKQTVAATSASSILLSPSIFPRASAVSATFENYRFLHISIFLLPLTSSSDTESYWILGFNSDVSQTIGLTSDQQLSECTPSACQGNAIATTNTASTFPTAHLNLGRKELLANTSLKWFKVVGDTGTNAWENFQGELLFYNPSSGSTTFNMFVRYRIEFASPVSTLITDPLDRALTMRELRTKYGKSQGPK